jgi:hypothetical protein
MEYDFLAENLSGLFHKERSTSLRNKHDNLSGTISAVI